VSGNINGKGLRMKFTISLKELKEAVAGLSRVVSSRAALQSIPTPEATRSANAESACRLGMSCMRSGSDMPRPPGDSGSGLSYVVSNRC
jgi:hypothetical protein